MMPYQYRHDIAPGDAAFEAWGATPAEMVVAAGDATMNVMVADLATINDREQRRLTLADRDLDMLLLQALQELIFWKDAKQLLLRFTEVTIREEGGQYYLTGEARGEALDPKRHDLIVDVKAVTLYRLQVQQVAQQWWATVVLDL